MKTKTLFKSALVVVSTLFFSQSIAQATLGGGLSYGSEIEEPGINIRAGALLNPNVHLGADLNYFFPGDDGISDVDVIALNANISFRLNAGDVLFLYPLVGINYTTVKYRYANIESRSNEVGANVGAGMGLNFGAISPFAEYKYVISDYDQSVFTVGILLNFGNGE